LNSNCRINGQKLQKIKNLTGDQDSGQYGGSKL